MKLHLAAPGQMMIGAFAYLTTDKGEWVQMKKCGLWQEVKDFAELLRPANAPGETNPAELLRSLEEVQQGIGQLEEKPTA